MKAILDCYTDEPAGLGVPPYLGVYPRYVYGQLKKQNKDEDIYYLTIDDVRLWKKYDSVIPETKISQKTDISVYNLSKNYNEASKIIENSDEIIVISGAHTSGKYLSAIPGSVSEVKRYLSDVKARIHIAGPESTEFGSSFHGGKKRTKIEDDFFDSVFKIENDYDKLRDFAILGAEVASQAFTPFIAELETAHGCTRSPGCSFCLEPMKNCLAFRKQDDIIKEAKILRKYTSFFRLGKQSCFFSYMGGKLSEIEKLLKSLSDLKPNVLHIDNANPSMVNEERTKLITRYCTSGNVAAFGAETFDPEVIKKNNLNSDPDTVRKAVEIINNCGKEKGENGMPLFLPGINILFGLIGESKKTFDYDFSALKEILDSDLLLRRINIRQVILFEGTQLSKEAGTKFLKKNKKYYWKWRNKIRQEIDFPILEKMLPLGSVLKDVYMEIYDGKHTFGRQFGTYPLIIGVSKRVETRKFYNVKVIKHNLRSIEVEIV
ncbi:MAG: radical SAM protein [Candidatus Woesearchaeota archaeon]